MNSFYHLALHRLQNVTTVNSLILEKNITITLNFTIYYLVILLHN